jgi:hypothetical protein
MFMVIAKYESGVVDVEGMEFGVMDELQPILEKSFEACVKYQLDNNPISIMLFRNADEPFRLVAGTEAFNSQFLSYASPLREVIEQGIEREDSAGLKVLRSELQSYIKLIDTTIGELE